MCLFWILHIAAIFAFPLALFVTVPLHSIAAILARRQRLDMSQSSQERIITLRRDKGEWR